MNEKKFDQLLREKMSAHDSQVPNHVWDNINRDLKKRKSKPILPIAFAVLGILAIALLTIYGLNRNNKLTIASDLDNIDLSQSGRDGESQTVKMKRPHVVSNNVDMEIGSQVTSGNQSRSGANSSATNNASNTTNSSETTDASARNTTKNRSTGSSSNTATQFSAELSLARASDENMNRINPDQTTSAVDQNLTGSKAKSNPIAPNDIASTDLFTQNETKFARVEAGQAILNNESHSTHLVQSSDGEINNQSSWQESELNIAGGMSEKAPNRLIEESKGVVIPEHRDEITARYEMAVSALAPHGKGHSLSIGQFVYDPCSVKGGKKKNRVHCYSFVKKSEITFADFSAGPQYSHKIFKLKLKDPEAIDLLNQREATESYMLSYNVQARVGIKTNSGLTGTVGLSYDRYNERFNYFDPNEQRTITTIIVVSGPDTTTTETIVFQANGERTIRHTNTMTFVSIPFTAGYMWQADKFNVGVHGGLSVNLLFSKGGRIVQGNGAATTLNGEAKKLVYKTTAGFSAVGGLIFEYKIRDNLSFIFEPQVKYNMRSLTNDDYRLDQRYLNVGLNVGLRTIINKKITQKKKYGV